MIEYSTSIRVRYAETDQMSYVYYGNYATYYEVARVELLRHLGTSYRKMEEDGVMLPVLELKSRFLKPVRYDELITIKVIIRELPRVRIRFEYELLNENNELVNQGETTLVFIDRKRNKPCAAPLEFINRLKTFF